VPIFEYECRECKKRFEQLVYSNETKVACRSCGSSRVVQLLSTFAINAASSRPAAELGPCGACGAAQRGACGAAQRGACGVE